MNYNINIDELNNIKIIIPKKNYYCSNCNKKGHTFKTCNESIISNGIIGIYIKNFNYELISLLENYISNNLNLIIDNNNNEDICKDDIKLDSSEINKNINFLIVQRKNSLGYLEFIRGRYNLENTTSIIHLIKQMTPDEIYNIKNIDFDNLWNNLWDTKNINNKNHYKEYIISKQKFYQLKLNYNNILKNTNPLYNFNEWGFPKGRREAYESDLLCAIREFEEETTLTEKNYTILEKCKSITENLVGTNGINYTHNYYLSIINNNFNSNNNDINNFTLVDEKNKEISQIKVLNLSECIEKIRPYHTSKIKIIINIYKIINEFLNKYSHKILY